MGITGLLPLLKPHLSKRHISHYKGQTAAIDTFAWIHRGAIPDARDLAYKRLKPNASYTVLEMHICTFY